jgi:hypothetical protein
MPDAKVSEIFSGEWVLLYEDKIIDHSVDIQDMLVLAQEKFPINKYPHGTIRSIHSKGSINRIRKTSKNH